MTETAKLSKKHLVALIQAAHSNWAYKEVEYKNYLLSLPKPLLQRAAWFAVEILVPVSDEEISIDYRSLRSCLEDYANTPVKSRREAITSLNVPTSFSSRFYKIDPSLFK